MRFTAPLLASLLFLLPSMALALPVAEAIVYTKQGERCFKLEVAATPETRERGLMERRKLAPNDGMLFLFPKPNRNHFWMKNTPLPLDMIFIGTERNVITIAPHTTPYSLDLVGAKGLVTAVIELDAGRAAKEGIAVGDNVRYELPESLEVY